MDNESGNRRAGVMLRGMQPIDPPDSGARRDAGGTAALRREPDGGATRLTAPAEGGEADFLHGVAAVAHEHLVPMRLLDAGAGRVELVRDAAPQCTLAGLLDERGSVDPGECVTVLVPVARAVAAVHAAGFLVGGLGPADVRLDATGRPVLALPRLPVGVSSEGRSGSCAEPWDDDVRDLGRLGATMLTGAPPGDTEESLLGQVPTAPRPLLALIGAVLDAPAGRLPTAAELATALIAACPPEPVQLPETWSPPVPDEPVSAGPLSEAAPDLHERPHNARRGEEPAAPGSRSLGGRGAGGGSDRRARRARPTAHGGRRRRPRAPRGRRRALSVLAVAVSVIVAAIGVLALVLALARAHVLPRSVATSASAAAAAGAAAAPSEGTRVPSGQPGGTPSRSAPGPYAALPAIASATLRVDERDDWRAVLSELNRRRAAALARPADAEFARVDVPRSPASARDEALSAAYAARGAHLEGFGIKILSVASPPEAANSESVPASTASRGVARVRLLVSDRLPGYDVVGGDGGRVQRAGRGARLWTVELRAVAGEWRIWDVQPAQGPATP